jgi:hypothetical protein
MGRVYLGHIDPGFLWDKYAYKPLTGELIRRYTDDFGHKAGDVVGSLNPKGYLLTTVRGRPVMLHRLVYVWVTGAEPPDGLHIHHIDENPANNAWNNLAVVTPKQHKRLHSKKQRLDDMR